MANPGRAFVDTNVLLYAYDLSDPVKRPIAQALLANLWKDRSGVLSTQVLQEFYSVATRKLTPAMDRHRAREIITLYSAWPVVLIDATVILAATRAEETYGLSLWDALIIEAARISGADRLLTEDLQHGQELGGVTVVNPFAHPATEEA